MNTAIRISLIGAVAMALHGIAAQAVEGGYAGAKAGFVPGEVIVKLKPGTRARPDFSAMGLRPKETRTSGGEFIYRIEVPRAATRAAANLKQRTLKAVEDLKKKPEVEYAQPNYILHILKTPNDPLYSRQWHYFNYGSGPGESLGGIDLPKVWETNTGSRNVVVAVIDTGILPDHPDIRGSQNLVTGYDMISNPSYANDGGGRDADASDPGDAIAQGECGNGEPDRPYPSSWHGTHVAGTIGAGGTDNGIGIAGINWQVKVQPVRVLGKCGGLTSDINDAIRWAAGIDVPGVPANATPAKVINMSLGGGVSCAFSPSTQSAIDDAVKKGVTVVVAAGNESADASDFTPAGCDNVITVAAANPKGGLAAYSNYGSAVEILAPGGEHKGCSVPADGVLSAVQVRDNNTACAVGDAYAYYNGTSMAAPHVAGVAALWLAQDAALTPKTLSDEMKRTARPRTSADCPRPCGAGLLNASRGAVPGPGGGVALNLALEPDQPNYAPGTTISARASVSSDGAPQAGKAVQFNSSNSAVASVAPASATTNSSGVAVATVTTHAAGNATITATSGSVKGQKTITVQQQVPDFSKAGFAALLAVAIAIGLFRRKAGRSEA